MPLNLEPRSSADFTPYLKFNGKAGRWYVRSDIGDDTEVLNLTAVFDLANIKTGWLLFSEGAAPDVLWDVNGSGIPPQPSPKHKRGFAVNVFSNQALGGLREFSSSSNGAIVAIKELYDLYEKTYDPDKALVPVVTCESVQAVKSKFGTNYQPVLKIVKWAPRPHDLPDTAPTGQSGGTGEDVPLPPPGATTAPKKPVIDEF